MRKRETDPEAIGHLPNVQTSQAVTVAAIFARSAGRSRAGRIESLKFSS